MAYINQETKKRMNEQIKPILKKYGLKGSLSIYNHNEIVLTISKGAIDFIANYNETNKNRYDHRGEAIRCDENSIAVNPYYFERDFSGAALECLTECMAILNASNWDKSDIMTDYFDVGWYVSINIGRWDKPYTLTA